MRRSAFPLVRLARPILLAVALLSCTSDRVLGPTAAPSADVSAAAAGPALVISEVMPDPSKVADGSGEWFEVYNAGTESVDLQNYRIVSASGATSTESHTIASSVVVDPGEYVVFGNNANTVTNGGVPVAYSYGSSIALNNGSSTSATEWLAIRTPATVSPAVTLDSVAYAVRSTPGAAPGPYTPPTGASRAVVDLNADNTIVSGSNWVTSVTQYGAGDRGTPGQPNMGGEPMTVTVRVSWVTPGTTFRVTASAVDADGKPSATNFTWSSANPEIATVNAVTGVATGVALGIATLTATASNGVQGSAPLFVVTPGDVASISISINDPAQVPAGYTKPAFPTVRNTSNTVVTGTPLVWTSSNSAVATVSDLGYVTGVAAGTAAIRATAPNGVYGEVPFIVEPADATTPAVYRNHVEFGTPADGTPDDDIILSKRQYVLSYNASRGGPNWVSWHINATHFGGVPRCDCFSADQTLPASVYHVVDFDYRNGGYDRGHMVQSESRTTTDQENAATFLLTNILPQAAENNQGPWSQLENYLNDLARQQGKEIYVMAGGIYGAEPATLKGEGKVTIPEYTWKVAVVMGAGQGLADVRSTSDLQVITVKMPNLTTAGVSASAVGIRNTPWQSYEVKVDDIEAATGYDLLAGLPDEIEILVEAKDRPPAAALVAPAAGVEGSALAFDGSGSSDPDGDALAYAWDFGDGTTGTGASPSHTYADNGSYRVTLTVSDPVGAKSTATATVVVSNAAPVVLRLDPSAPTILSGQSVGVAGDFRDAGSADSPWGYTIDWGAGLPTSGRVSSQAATIAASRTYLAEGTYTIRLTVTDKDGASGAATAQVRVNRLPIGIDIKPGGEPNSISLSGNGDGRIAVAVLTTPTFDAGLVDPMTARLGSTSVSARRNGSLFAAREDVDGDGDLDLVVHFDRALLIENRDLVASTTSLVFLADLTDGRQVQAQDAVRVVP